MQSSPRRQSRLHGNRFRLVTLGCFRNEVDSDQVRSGLEELGLKETGVLENADLVLINTCGFIQEARQEGIDTILEIDGLTAELERRPPILVIGCMPQRFSAELLESMPEINGVLGVRWDENLEDAVSTVLSGERYDRPIGPPTVSPQPRTVDSSESATLLIRTSDGCDRRCSFCAIPIIKGPLTSRPIEEILDEAERLADGGQKEVLLLAQDLTSYGIDLYGEQALDDLIRRISNVEGVHWIRLLYLQPEGLGVELIDSILENPVVCDYFDIPFQHASKDVLGRMGRPGDRRGYAELIDSIRTRAPDAAVRTTVMVGFPGETEEDFNELLDFIEDIRFDWLGAFCYSTEEGTVAAGMPGKLPEATVIERYDKILRLQDFIEESRVADFLGRELEVVIDDYCEYDDFEFIGRSYREAPIVDGIIYLRIADPGNTDVKPGNFATALITGQEGLDLVAEIKRPR